MLGILELSLSADAIAERDSPGNGIGAMPGLTATLDASSSVLTHHRFRRQQVTEAAGSFVLSSGGADAVSISPAAT